MSVVSERGGLRRWRRG